MVFAKILSFLFLISVANANDDMPWMNKNDFLMKHVQLQNKMATILSSFGIPKASPKAHRRLTTQTAPPCKWDAKQPKCIVVSWQMMYVLTTNNHVHNCEQYKEDTISCRLIMIW